MGGQPYSHCSRAAIEQAFHALYQRHQTAVRSYVSQRSHPMHVEDLVSEVFLVAWRRFASVPPEPEARYWLIGVARRVISGHRRSRIRRWRLLERLAREPQSDGDKPTFDCVHDALSLLNEHDRKLLLMLEWQGLSRREVARALGCGVNAVNVRVHRARRRFAQAFAVLSRTRRAQ